MDNAPWHKGQDLKEIIESTGEKLIKLPPSSPDLNPIEHAWANLKEVIKTKATMCANVTQNINAQLRNMNHFNLARLYFLTLPKGLIDIAKGLRSPT